MDTTVWKKFNVDTDNVTGSQTSSDVNYTQLLTTGASEQTNKMNIYDFAGNEWEWTLEKTSIVSNPCANRGVCFYDNSSDYPVSSRYHNITTNSYSNVGFRSTLY